MGRVSTRDGDPLSVLRNHGLLTIDKSPRASDSPVSEIDLTFYTEETHLGEPVKLFSSTHKFRNGALVYSATQEAAPDLTEEVQKFNERWECKQGRIKSIQDKGAESTNGKSLKKKSLLEMMEDSEREQTLKRYEAPQPREVQRCWEAKSEKETEENKKNKEKLQRLKKYFEKTPKMKKETFETGESSCRECEPRHYSQHDPTGKKVYHACWRHRSPPQASSRNVRFAAEKTTQHACSQTEKKRSKKAAKRVQPSPIKANAISIPRIKQPHGKDCDKEWLERLKGVKCRHPFTVREEHQGGSSKSLFSGKFSNEESVSLHTEEKRRTNKIQSPDGHLHGTAQDNEESDSKTSTCTVYYECEDSTLFRKEPTEHRESSQSEPVSPNLHHMKREINCKCCIKILPCPRDSTLSSPREEMRGEKNCHCQLTTEQFVCPIETSVDCYAQCHQRDRDLLRTVLAKGCMHKENSKSMKILESIVNREALREFQKRYDACKIHKSKVAPSFAREHFIHEIREHRKSRLQD